MLWSALQPRWLPLELTYVFACFVKLCFKAIRTGGVLSRWKSYFMSSSTGVMYESGSIKRLSDGTVGTVKWFTCIFNPD